MSVIITSGFLLSPPAASPALNHARIGYHTYHATSTWTASTSAAGFPASSLLNSITMRRWKPTAVPATITADAGAPIDISYVGIAAHTFGDNANTIAVEYSLDSVTYTEITQISPASNKPIMVLCDVTARYIRVKVLSGSAPSIGVIYFGQVLEMERSFYQGHTPQALSVDVVKVPRVSESGQFLSSTSIRKGTSSDYQWQHLTPAWYRSNFVPFVSWAENNPFFIAWNPSQYPNEVEFAWTNDNIKPTNSGPRDFMSVGFSAVGLGDE